MNDEEMTLFKLFGRFVTDRWVTTTQIFISTTNSRRSAHEVFHQSEGRSEGNNLDHGRLS